MLSYASTSLAAIVAVPVVALVRARRILSTLSFAGLALLGVAPTTGPWDFDVYLGGLPIARYTCCAPCIRYVWCTNCVSQS